MPKPSADDPSTEYSTYDEEMVKRAPIIVAGNTNGTEQDGPFDDTSVGDRGKVWDLICPLLITTEAWPHVKSARKIRDGRKAMLAFYDHFLGRGQCPECGGWGALYNLCQYCEDLGMIYDSPG